MIQAKVNYQINQINKAYKLSQMMQPAIAITNRKKIKKRTIMRILKLQKAAIVIRR